MTCLEQSGKIAPVPGGKRKVLEAAVQVVDSGVPVLNGVAEFTTQNACDTSKAAEVAGGWAHGHARNGVLGRSGNRSSFSVRGRLGQSSNHVLQQSSGLQGDITPEMFKQMEDVENIVCIKEASGDVRRITDLFNALGDRYLVFAGLDDVALESFMLGCTGWISGLVDAFHERIACYGMPSRRGIMRERWRSTGGKIPMLHFDSHPKLVQYIKLTCATLGYGTETVRAPRLPLIGEERERILSIVEECVATRP